MNELINTEIWSTGLYLSLQVYFEDERLPILSSWLNSQAQDNMNLKSATKPLNVLIAFTRPLITEFADNLNLKHPLLPTISPYPTM